MLLLRLQQENCYRESLRRGLYQPILYSILPQQLFSDRIKVERACLNLKGIYNGTVM